jgi:hypothetical protein
MTVVAGGGIDFASGLHKNKTASNVAYSSGASVESLRPAQAGADVTGSNQSASTATLNGTPASAININGGSFTVGGSGANFYPVQLKSLTPAWANSSNARSNYLELYRDNVHENGSWYGVFTLELGFHPSNWGNWPNNPVEYLFYKPGGGGTANGAAYNWNDPLGDIQDGTAQSGGSDVIIWLRGGATYHWQNVNPASGWQLLNGNSGGTSITNSSGATCNIISAQTAMVMAAKGGQSTPGYTSDHAGISCGGVPIIGSGGKAVDQTGNLKLKNTKSVPWVTANPSVNTSTFADLPELGSGNSAMTIALAGNPVVIGANLNFYGATGSGTSGPVIGIGTTFTQPTAQRTVNQGPPQVYIVITGNGTGAGAGVSWAFTQQGIGPAPAYIPYGYFTPTLSITGGQGYTTASATVTITNGESAYPNGSNPYNCSIGVSTPVSGVPIQARILMDGIPVVGPVQVTTDSKGYASLTFPLTLQFPSQAAHSFQVQAWNLNNAYTVTSTSRQFQLVELG